jgi:hypothetical protein
MTDSPKLSVVKTTLSTGKVVLLHQLKIKHTERAAEQIATEAGESQQLFQFKMQKALVQQLLFKVDDKIISMAERDDMDKLFNTNEYSQILKVIGKISGGDEKQKDPQIELVAASE